jgi:hypothetical protein
MADIFSTELPITFDLEEAIEYYRTLQKDYPHLKWKMPTSGFRVVDEEGHEPNITGWALQSPKDPSEPHCMLHDFEIQGREFYKETPCAFGFGKKLLDFFPTAFRMYMFVTSPGVVVTQHYDDTFPQRIYRMHIPIETNDKAIWIVEGEKLHMPAGKVFLVDPLKILHGTENYGDTDRVHIVFEFLEQDIDAVKQLSGHI